MFIRKIKEDVDQLGMLISHQGSQLYRLEQRIMELENKIQPNLNEKKISASTKTERIRIKNSGVKNESA